MVGPNDELGGAANADLTVFSQLYHRWRKSVGFTVIELLVSITIVSLIMTAVVSSLAVHNKAAIQQDRLVSMEENLRAGMGMIAEALRNTGYGVPRTALNLWLGDSSFSAFPLNIATAQQLKLATCTSLATATLTVQSAANATTLTLNSVSGLSNTKSIWIGRSEFAKITGISGNTITIDTNMMTAGNQGLFRVYPVSTPICRIDILTFTVNPSTKQLTLLRNDVAGAQAQLVAEEISSLVITQVIQRRLYRVALTGQTKNIQTNADITRTLTSEIALVNG